MEFLYGLLLGLVVPILLILACKFDKPIRGKIKETEEDVSSDSLDSLPEGTTSNKEYRTYRVVHANGEEEFIKTTKTLDELTKELNH